MSIPYLPAPETSLGRLVRNDFFIAAVIAVVLSGATFALAYGLGWLTTAPNWFEVSAATLNYGATYLSIKQRRLAYTLGFVASAGFAVAYFQYGLLASSILSLYLVGQLIYGYFRWGKDSNTRPVHHLSWKWLPAYIVATVLVYLGAVGIVTLLGGHFAFWDAAILVLTIAAQFLLDNKVIESWYVWTAVNVIGVVLYFTAGAPFAAIQQLIFGLANVWGYLAWRKTMLADRDRDVVAHNTDFDPNLTLQGYAAADVAATQALFDAIPIRERITKYNGDSKLDATFHPMTTENDQVNR